MSTIANDQDQRRIQRYSLALPTTVEVRVDNNITWREVTRLEDVSSFGAGFVLKRPVKRGRLIHMSIPMPRQLRCFDFLDPQYKIWGLVRRCIQLTSPASGETYGVGVAFVGKHAPSRFSEDPSALFDLAVRPDGGLWELVEADAMPDETDVPLHLRRHTRFAIPEPLLLEMLDSNGDVTKSETTVTENISLGGAAVLSSFDAPVGSFLRVRSERNDLSIISIVRGRRIGEDGIGRLHLEFIDHMFPLEGIA